MGDKITEGDVVSSLKSMLMGDPVGDTYLDKVDSCSTYQEAGIITYNEGLVIRLPNGQEFQVTIVQSR
jgi:hypothetical protein